MAFKKTKEQIIEDARAVHGDRYVYDEMEYVNNHTPVKIICRIHGPFWQKTNSHISGKQGCPICGRELASKKISKPFSQFEEEARKVHGDKYVYDEGTYTQSSTKMKVICPEHGEFWVTPSHHINGVGCPKCARTKKVTSIKHNKKGDTDSFVIDAKLVHGDDYIYDDVDYVNAITKVKIICPKHGPFWQTPYKHLIGQKCPICAKEGQYKSQTFTTEEFVAKAKIIHGDDYIYDDTNYINSKTKVKIVCPKHGEFWQYPHHHLQGMGCPKCGAEKISQKLLSDTKEFITKSKVIHGDKYIYNDSDYIASNIPVWITCPTHGKFQQMPYHHLRGCGCPHCGRTISKPEEEIYQFLCQFIPSDDIIRHDKNVLNGLEIDILLPTFKLGIEFNGLVWHSEKYKKNKNYHVDKTNLAESKGYHLIQIFEDEWIEHKDIVLNKLRHFIGKDGDKVRIGARKCLVEPVSKDLAMDFLSKYHIQGFAGSTIYLGGYYNGELMAVMSFKQEQPDMWNLTRYASNTDYLFPGLANKIVHHFIKEYNPVEIKTFLDRRWSHSGVNVYDRMGFKLVETLAPDYRYIDGNERKHKFGFRKNTLHKKYGVSLDLTEREMTEQLGFERIWDCGLYKYVWTKAED